MHLQGCNVGPQQMRQFEGQQPTDLATIALQKPTRMLQRILRISRCRQSHGEKESWHHPVGCATVTVTKSTNLAEYIYVTS